MKKYLKKGMELKLKVLLYLMEKSSGYKTYMVSSLSLVYGVAGYLLGALSLDQAVPYVLGGLAGYGIGHKLDKLKK